MTQAELLTLALDNLERLGIPHMLVGSVASGVYGEPRLTLDIDIVIDPAPQDILRLCAAFDPDEFYVSLDAARQALHQPGGQFNVIDPASANKIDFMIARHDAWGRQQMARRHRAQILPTRQGYAAQAEDIIISKLLYYQEGGSEKHMRDITGILKVRPTVDRAYVARWAAVLDVTDIWQAVLARVAP